MITVGAKTTKNNLTQKHISILNAFKIYVYIDTPTFFLLSHNPDDHVECEKSQFFSLSLLLYCEFIIDIILKMVFGYTLYMIFVSFDSFFSALRV